MFSMYPVPIVTRREQLKLHITWVIFACVLNQLRDRDEALSVVSSDGQPRTTREISIIFLKG